MDIEYHYYITFIIALRAERIRKKHAHYLRSEDRRLMKNQRRIKKFDE